MEITGAKPTDPEEIELHNYVACRLRSTLTRAIKTGKSFSLSFVDMYERVKKGHCEVTKLPFVFDEPWSPWTPSFDRIDSSKDYTPDNMQVVVLMYNHAKGKTASEDDLLLFCSSLIKERLLNENIIG